MDAHTKQIALRHLGKPGIGADRAIANIFDNETQDMLWRFLAPLESPDIRRRSATATSWEESNSFVAIAPYSVGIHRGRVEFKCSTLASDVVAALDMTRPRSIFWSMGEIWHSYSTAPPQWLCLEFNDTFLWKYYISEAIVLATCAHICRSSTDVYLEMTEGNWHKLFSLSRDAIGGCLLRFGALFQSYVRLNTNAHVRLKRDTLAELAMCGVDRTSTEAAKASIEHQESAEKRMRQVSPASMQGAPGTGLRQSARPTPTAGTPAGAKAIEPVTLGEALKKASRGAPQGQHIDPLTGIRPPRRK
jgi:hypothetical protein